MVVRCWLSQCAVETHERVCAIQHRAWHSWSLFFFWIIKIAHLIRCTAGYRRSHCTWILLTRFSQNSLLLTSLVPEPSLRMLLTDLFHFWYKWITRLFSFSFLFALYLSRALRTPTNNNNYKVGIMIVLVLWQFSMKPSVHCAPQLIHLNIFVSKIKDNFFFRFRLHAKYGWLLAIGYKPCASLSDRIVSGDRDLCLATTQTILICERRRTDIYFTFDW